MTARRAVRSAVVWGVILGYLVYTEIRQFSIDFPTVELREQFAQSLGSNTALAAIIGPARDLDTVGGYVSWRMFGLLVILGAIWALLVATRLMRGEEDAGRWEVLLAGRTRRRHAAVQAMLGLAAGWLVLWALIAVATVAGGRLPEVGFSVTESLFYATAATASAAMFLAVGALTSQLAATRRQANGLAAAVFGVAYLIRMVADSGTGLDWMRWLSPLGWVENLAPLTDPQPLALIPIVVLVVAASSAAIVLADRRDVGAGAWVRQPSARTSTALLESPGLLVVRLERWVAISWVVGLGLMALVFGVVAEAAAEGNVGVEGIEEVVGRLGGQEGGAKAWIGYEFLFVAAFVGFVAANQISAMWGEEGDGHLDHLLARPVSRARWLAGRVGFGVALLVAVGVATGVGGWVGLVLMDSDIGFMEMLGAGLNVTVPALFVLGVGTLLYGVAPRWAVRAIYALVLWTFLVELVGSSITTNEWLLDTAVLTHIGPVPADTLNWAALGWLVGLGGLAGVIGLLAFNRRDLVAG